MLRFPLKQKQNDAELQCRVYRLGSDWRPNSALEIPHDRFSRRSRGLRALVTTWARHGRARLHARARARRHAFLRSRYACPAHDSGARRYHRSPVRLSKSPGWEAYLKEQWTIAIAAPDPTRRRQACTSNDNVLLFITDSYSVKMSRGRSRRLLCQRLAPHGGSDLPILARRSTVILPVCRRLALSHLALARVAALLACIGRQR